MKQVDLFLALLIFSIVLFCFMEVNLTFGLASMGFGVSFLLYWFEFRAELFSK